MGWSPDQQRGVPLKALSIRQPWADAIVYHRKDIENRSWPTRFRGPVLIHAAKAWGEDERLSLLSLVSEGLVPDCQQPLLGGIVGVAEIVDCVTRSDSRWFVGPYGFVLRNARPLSFRPCRGALGFFDPVFPDYEQEASGIQI